MRAIRLLACLLFVLLASVGATAPALAWDTLPSDFFAVLSGGSEVPPHQSMGAGFVAFSESEDGNQLAYTLLITNLPDATAAHIHLGAPGENGPIVVFLFTPDNPNCTAEPSLNDFRCDGVVTADDVIGPLAGDFQGLIDAMHSGDTYANAHTPAFPGGEIRGQILGNGAIAPAKGAAAKHAPAQPPTKATPRR